MDADRTWAALRGGDETAFRDVFGAHSRAVYNFSFRHTASWSVAEDATQAAFATVWRLAGSGRLPRLASGGVRAWLCGVARNECRNLTRTARRHLSLVHRVGSEPEAPAADNVADWVAHEESMLRINEVLARVPDAQRQVIEMVAWAGLGMVETAEALGVPVGTVKSRLARARQALATTEVAHLLGKEI